MNPETGWLVRRAALAIGLMIGFYVMALAIGLGLLAIPYLAWADAGVRLPAKLILVCVGAGLTVLWAIVPRPDRFTAPGPRLDEASHPDLFRMIRDVASATEQELPADVYLLNEVNAWVTHRGGIMGFGSHRVMGVGLPLLQALSQLELKAIVAHEFGHYASGDVKIGPWIYKTRAAIGRTLEGVHGGFIAAPFKWYGAHFLRLTHDVSRQQEFIADRIAAGIAGAAAMSSALRKVTALAPTFSSYLSNELGPVLRAGFLPPITTGFDDFLRAERILALSQRTIEEAQSSSVTDELDTHPCLRDRLEALKPLRDRRSYGANGDAPASALLLDMEAQATALMRFVVGAETFGKLQPLAWDAVGDRVYAPMWTDTVKHHAKWLGQFTADTIPGDLPSLKRAGAALVQAGAEHPDVDIRVVAASQIMGIGLAALLLEHGWRVSTAPGKPLVLVRDADVIDPFTVVKECAELAGAADQWKARCAAIGIAGRQLAQPAEAGTRR